MPDTNDKDRKILVDAKRCQCCWMCVMHCSLRFGESISPASAKITVKPFYYGHWPEISFDKDCDMCGICARHCPSGAITLEKRIAA